MDTTTADPRRWWALGALVMGVLVLGFDMTILNVALPTMATELEADTGDLQWIVDAYTIVFAALLLPAGLLGDRFGRKKLILIGLAIFGAASLLGTFADSVGMVVAARALMGIGGALIMPLSMSILPSLFPAEERSRAISLWAAGMALGMPLGPILGGLLLQHFWWGSVFLLNVPFVVLAGIACALLLPESRDPHAGRIDAPASVFGAVGLAALVFGVIEAPRRGWGDPVVLVLAASGVLLLVALVLRETRARTPMIDFGLFRDRHFLWGSMAAVVPSFVMGGVLFVLPQRFAAVDGFDALGTGVRLVPMMGGLLVAAVLSDRLVPRLGFRVVIPTGLVLLGGAVLLGATGSVSDGYGRIALWLTLAGFGLGLSLVPATDAVMATIAPERAGVGSALLQSMRQVGGALGIALLGSLLAAAYSDRLDAGGPADDSVAAAAQVALRTGDTALLADAQSAFVHGMDLVLVVCGVVALAVALLVAAFLPGRDAATAKRAEPPADRPDDAAGDAADDTPGHAPGDAPGGAADRAPVASA
ncbi:MFS transporter [Streptomycetaceae bacterium NBC_01309]